MNLSDEVGTTSYLIKNAAKKKYFGKYDMIYYKIQRYFL